MIFISVIIPVYNKEKYISKCIESILQQTYENFELILVNDGSSDSSGTICEQYARLDERIKVINKVNGGASYARNIGIQNALGEYITFVDSDDYAKENMLECLIKPVLQNNADISICGFETRDFDSDKLINVFKLGQNVCCNREEFVKKYFYEAYTSNAINSISNKLYRKNIIDKYHLRYNEKYSIQEDRIFIIQMLLKCEIISNIDQSLYCYMINNENSLYNQYASTDFEATWELYHILSNFLKNNNATEEAIKYIENDLAYIFISRIVIMYRNKVISKKEKYLTFRDLINNIEFQSLLKTIKSVNAKYALILFLFRIKMIFPVHIALNMKYRRLR